MDKRSEGQFDAPVSPSKMSDAEAEHLLNTKYKGLKGLDMSKVSSVSMPSRGDTRPGTGKWDFGGGRLQVNYRTPEELGPRDKFKFDKNNPADVEELSTPHSERQLHEGGYYSLPASTQSTKAPKAPKAPKKKAAPAPVAKTPIEDKSVKVTSLSEHNRSRAKVLAEKDAKSKAIRETNRAKEAERAAKLQEIIDRNS